MPAHLGLFQTAKPLQAGLPGGSRLAAAHLLNGEGGQQAASRSAPHPAPRGARPRLRQGMWGRRPQGELGRGADPWPERQGWAVRRSLLGLRAGPGASCSAGAVGGRVWRAGYVLCLGTPAMRTSAPCRSPDFSVSPSSSSRENEALKIGQCLSSAHPGPGRAEDLSLASCLTLT